jgi:AAA15 family ATPase/GTPase
MILSFSVQNFLSFRDKVTLSFEATSDKSLEEYHVVQIDSKTRINKLGVVYGANASGKSNLIKAFQFLYSFFDDSTQNKERPLPFFPFLLDENSKQENTQFELVFYIGQSKYLYRLELNPKQVITEKLFKYNSIRPTELFKRWLENGITVIGFSERLQVPNIVKDELQLRCLNNMSVFAAYKNINAQIPEIDTAANWISQQLLPIVTPGTQLTEFAKSLIDNNKAARNYILHFLHQADFNIKDITIKPIEYKLDESEIPKLIGSEGLSIKQKEVLIENSSYKTLVASYYHEVVWGGGKSMVVGLPEFMQSAGTLRTMGIAGVFSRVMAANGFVAIDELEASLHPQLISYLIETFLKESDRAQLLFTTHYDGLLAEEDLLRKDAIWFTEKRVDGSTSLYSLSDFNGLNRISSLQKAYRYGKFGAIPNI